MSDIKRVFGIVTVVFAILLAVPFVSVFAEDSDGEGAGWSYSDQIGEDERKIYNAASETFRNSGDAGMVFRVSGLGMVMVKTGDGSEGVMMDRVMSAVRSALTASVMDDPLAYWGWSTVEGSGFTVNDDCISEFKNGNVSYLSVTEVTVTIQPVPGGSDMTELKSKAADVQKTVDGFKSEGDRKKILTDINKYLTDNLTLGDAKVLAHTAYSALGSSDKVTTPDGYAQAFKLLCDKYGIPCAVVIGETVSAAARETAMWNCVEAEGDKWFAYDSAMNERHGNESYSMCGYLTVCSDGYAFAASHQADPARMAAGLSDIIYPVLQDKIPDPEPGFVDKYGAQLICVAIGVVIIIALLDMARRMSK